MNLFSIAFKSIRQRWLASSLTALSIALGVALMVAVLVINGVVSRMFSQNATGYDLIVGAKGSPMQLVLNTIYFLDRPIENITYKNYQDLKHLRPVEHAIPFALGDTTEDGRFRIVGTIREYFDLEYIPRKHFELQGQGKFLDGMFDAVIGARVARAYDWQVGHTFPIAHGGNTADIHSQKFTVVGILAPTGLPLDRAVFIQYDGFNAIPEHFKAKEEAEAEAAARGGAGRGPELMLQKVKANPDGGGPGRQADRVMSDEQKRVTAVLLQMKGKSDVERAALSMGLKYSINKSSVAQAVDPIEQISRLLRDVVGNIRTTLVVMTALIIVVSGVGIFVSIYNSMSDRKREIAVMRALGARRGTVFSIIIAESVLLCAGGAIVGLILGHALVFIARPIVEARSDILINPWSFETQELVIFPALLLLAVVVGLVPGLTAYRADVAKGLSD